MKLFSPFFAKHIERGAKFMEMGDWEVPSVYTSPEEEYGMVRERAGFIDYSFQCAMAVTGKDAYPFLQKMLVNDLRRIHPGKAIYSSLVDETGKILDDTIVFWIEENLFIINGGPTEGRTLEWLKKNAGDFDVSVIRTGTCVLALQGPMSRDILQKSVNVIDLSYYSLKQDKLGGIPVLLARVGYSGELGYELHVYSEYAHALWDSLMELGKDWRVGPYGMRSQSLLAIEKGFLGSRDFYEGSTPLEVGLGWTVGFDKADFIGKKALLKRRGEGLRTKLVGLEVVDPQTVASAKDNLLKDGKVVGQATRNGIYGPTVGKSIGRAWVGVEYAKEGEELELQHEDKRTKIKVTTLRWYDPENEKVKA